MEKKIKSGTTPTGIVSIVFSILKLIQENNLERRPPTPTVDIFT